jgi:hypothetical protein
MSKVENSEDINWNTQGMGSGLTKEQVWDQKHHTEKIGLGSNTADV